MKGNYKENEIINRFFWLILLVVAGLTLFPGLADLPIIDRDEPRFAHATVEMMDRNEWAVPYFNDEYRFDKPPLTYWWMRLHFWLGGVNEWAARLHSTLASYFVSLVIFSFAVRLTKDSWSSLLGAAAWLGSLQVMVHSRLAVADMPMVFFLTLGMWALWEMLHSNTRQWGVWYWVFWLSMGLGFLAKGPIVLFVVILAGLIHTAWVLKSKGEWVEWHHIQPLSGSLITLVIVALWGIPAQIATDWMYGQEGIGTHVIERGTKAFNGRVNLPFVYYFVSIMLSLLPWASLLPSVLFKQDVQALSKQRSGDPQLSFFFGWFLAPMLIFAFYATQLPHYVMPGFPAYFILIALLPWDHLTTPQGKKSPLRFIFSFPPVFLSSLVGGILIFGSFLFPQAGDVALLGRGVFWLGVVISSLSVGSLALLWYNRFFAVFATLVAGVCFGYASYYLGQAHVTPKIIADLDLEGKKLYAIGYEEPSLVWYSDAIWDMNKNLDQIPLNSDDIVVIELKRWKVEGNGAELLRMIQAGESPIEEQFDQADEILPKLYAHGRQVKVVQGWNTAQSSWTEVAVSYR